MDKLEKKNKAFEQKYKQKNDELKTLKGKYK